MARSKKKPVSRSRVAALLSDNTAKDDFAEFEEIK